MILHLSGQTSILYAYENDFMTNVIGNDRLRAKRFHATRRFIDDLCGINDGGEFGRSHPDIYPNELELKAIGGGVQGQKSKSILYESTFRYGSNAANRVAK